jgi:hypothetical protein
MIGFCCPVWEGQRDLLVSSPPFILILILRTGGFSLYSGSIIL